MHCEDFVPVSEEYGELAVSSGSKHSLWQVWHFPKYECWHQKVTETTSGCDLNDRLFLCYGRLSFAVFFLRWAALLHARE